MRFNDSLKSSAKLKLILTQLLKNVILFFIALQANKIKTFDPSISSINVSGTSKKYPTKPIWRIRIN